VSDGARPIELYRALAVEPGDGAVRVVLGNQPASCKPRDRWLEGKADSAPAACCGPATKGDTCCT